MQVVTICGNVGKDMELRATKNGTTVGEFSVAVNKKKPDGTDETSWYRCSMFGSRAERIAQYITKGKKVTVVGELSPGVWESESGAHINLDIAVYALDFVGGGEQKQEHTTSTGYQRPAQAPAPAQYDYEEDIPF